MRNISLVLVLAAVVMVAVLARRFMHSAPGPKTWAFACATFIVIIAAAITWFRARGASAPPTA